MKTPWDRPTTMICWWDRYTDRPAGDPMQAALSYVSIDRPAGRPLLISTATTYTSQASDDIRCGNNWNDEKLASRHEDRYTDWQTGVGSNLNLGSLIIQTKNTREENSGCAIASCHNHKLASSKIDRNCWKLGSSKSRYDLTICRSMIISHLCFIRKFLILY